MFSVATTAFLLTTAATAFAQEGASASSVAQLVSQLRSAPTQNDRFRLLADDQFLFDFNNPNTTVGTTGGAAGHTVAATSSNFPAVVGQGVSMTIGFLGPCGMNSPHTHPRATEINFSLNTTLRGGVLVENGSRFVEIDIAPGMATVFPQGAIHFEMNPSCEDAMFVASFNGEDPGVNQVAQRYFGLPPDIVGATLGGLGVQDIANIEALIPDNVILGVDECLQRCGINRTAQATSQRQPRVAANAFPNNITPVNTFGLPAANVTANSGEGESAPASEGSGEGESAPASEGSGEGESAPAEGEGESAPASEGSGEGESAPASEGSGEGESAPAEGEGSGEGESAPAEGEGSGEGESSSSEGEGESAPAEGEGEGSGESAPAEGEGEGAGESTPAEGSGEGSGESAPAEGSGESAPAEGEGEGSGESAPAEGEGSGEGESAPAEGEGSGEGESAPAEGEGSGEGESAPAEGEGSGEGESAPAEGEGSGEGESAPAEGEGSGEGESAPAEGEGSGEGESAPAEGEGEGSGESSGASAGEGAPRRQGQNAPWQGQYAPWSKGQYAPWQGSSVIIDKRAPNVVVDSAHPEVTQISLR